MSYDKSAWVEAQEETIRSAIKRAISRQRRRRLKGMSEESARFPCIVEKCSCGNFLRGNKEEVCLRCGHGRNRHIGTIWGVD